MRFYLGTHELSWLDRPDVDVPLFVSRRRFSRRRQQRPATTRWALDSGGFTELAKYGTWTVSPADYVAEVRELERSVGSMDWAAPQDWMCEPSMLAMTGLTVEDHQLRTVHNFATLRHLAPDLPFIPVLQGQTVEDYDRCVRMYETDLTAFPVVGLGSVCRRQATGEIGEIVAHLHSLGLALHGFGCKAGALERYGQLLASADSLAWSMGGRHDGTCPGKSRCQNHLHWALDWRAKVVGTAAGGTVQMPLVM